MFDHDPFGQTGRTRGVDHVRQMRSAQARHRRVVLRLRRPCAQIDINHWHAQQRQSLVQIALREHRDRCAVAQQITDPLGRMRRIDRHIAGAGLEDGDQPDQCIQAPAGDDGHAVIGFHPDGDQVMRQGIGLAIELQVSQWLSGKHRCNSLRTLGDLRFEALGNRQPTRVVSLGRIEIHQQLFALSCRQDRQPVKAHVRRVLQCLQQRHQRSLHVPADTLRINAGPGQYLQAEVFTEIINAESQAIVGVFLGSEQLHAVPRRLHLSGYRPDRHAVTIVEQRAEQRRARRHGAALLHLRQLRMFMGQQLTQAFVGRQCGAFDAMGVQLDAQRQGIDEHTECPLRSFTALQSPEQHRAKHHGVASGQLPQHLCPGEVHQAGGADPQTPGLLTDAVAQRVFQVQLRLLCRAVAGQILPVRQGRLINSAEHLAEETGVRLRGQAGTGVRHVIAVRHRFAQQPVVAQQKRLHLVLQHLQRHVIHHQVMEQQQRHHALIGLIAAVHHAHQRRLGDGHAVVIDGEASAQLAQRIARFGV
ncbi:hypothetical protein D3C87_813250 [compost metagenome]